MSERAAYSRLYWSIVDDPKFVRVYDDDHHFAAWTRLLLIADQSHPASAHLPSNVRRASVKLLADVELIDLQPGNRYRIHGLDAEREKRRLAATSRGSGGDRPPPVRGPSGDRPVTEPSPTGIQTRGLRRDEVETSLDETNARASDDERWDAPEQAALVWLARHGCDVRPGSGWHQKLIPAVEVHGVEKMLSMFDRLADAGMAQGDTKGYLFGAIDALNARTRPSLAALEKEEAAEERADVRSKRIARQMWERRLELHRETGQWDDAWGPVPVSNDRGAA